MCWYCGTPVTDPEPLGRSLACPVCGKDLRCCKNCRFCLPPSQGYCLETRADKTSSSIDQDRAGFCDWFSLNQNLRKAHAGAQKENGAASKARSVFEDLFK
ncbi:MAG: hypothetical protein LBB82_01140 [Treponema sp.]|jgi:hypothetical protein|nr:hypothetical protein [Treponema sp.]